MTGKVKALRKRVIRCLPRELLDELSAADRPWSYDRVSIEARVLAEWEADDSGVLADEIFDWLKRHTETPVSQARAA